MTLKDFIITESVVDPAQPQQNQPAQPPPYLVGYAPAPAALQQASNNVSTIVFWGPIPRYVDTESVTSVSLNNDVIAKS